METATGVFASRDRAEEAVKELREQRQPDKRFEPLKSCEMGHSGESLTKMPHDLTESGAFFRVRIEAILLQRGEATADLEMYSVTAMWARIQRKEERPDRTSSSAMISCNRRCRCSCFAVSSLEWATRSL